MDEMAKPSTPTVGQAQGRRGTDRSPIQVIARAAAVLRALEKAPEGLSLAAIAAALNLPRSTIQRIVGALEIESLAIGATPTGRVKLGPALLRLAAAVDNSAASVAKPYMLGLAQELGETIDLSALVRDQAVIIEQTIGGHRVYAIAAVAVQFPLHCTANGKAMLALLGDAEIERRCGGHLERRTPSTITNMAELLKEIHVIRRTGVAFTNEENALGVSAIGVGFRDTHGNCLALSSPVPTARFKAQRTKIARRLLETRSILQTRFGTR
jgi:DNA-binding IclR family transcriptional regulator